MKNDPNKKDKRNQKVFLGSKESFKKPGAKVIISVQFDSR